MIIGISGKKQSGKDTVGKIIQYFTGEYSTKEINEILKSKKEQVYFHKSSFEIKKFADKVKDIVCLLINCTREQLENEDFKNTELGKEWWLLICTDGGGIYGSYLDNINRTLTDTRIEKLTPRKLLQLVGTECGRDIIHPNIWVNSTMNGYMPYTKTQKICKGHLAMIHKGDLYPNWIITDVRFPNELKAIKDRGGFVIRINKKRPPCGNQAFEGTQEEWDALVKRNNEANAIYNHPSETALDNVKFQYVLEHQEDLNILVEQVKEILIKENIL